MKFSQRIGKTPVRDLFQLESIDTILENRLWNAIYIDFFEQYSSVVIRNIESNRSKICKIIWVEFFGNRVDELPRYTSGYINTPRVINSIRDWYLKSEWYQQYDFIEYLAVLASNAENKRFIDSCNHALNKEMSGYRIISNKVVQITSDQEVAEIEQALESTSIWRSVNTHLTAALEFLSDRENPDYRNSVKESISAVEALCVIITGDKDASLGKALSIIEKKYQIHAALKSAFSSLYGYTSDSGGIRHKLLEDDIAVTMEDAKFMLLSCSAFINYLKVRIEK